MVEEGPTVYTNCLCLLACLESIWHIMLELQVDSGFDVWVGNVRGTRWSHGHVSLSEHSKAFWDWSWEELAGRDLPDMIEFVHSATGSKVYYVGHSQGTIMAFAAFTQPVVVNMIAAAALLCPISYLDHITSSDMAVQLADFVCADEDMNCGDLLTSITGPPASHSSLRISPMIGPIPLSQPSTPP
eukprot:Gb_14892 [translate_table: standard]